MGAHIQYFPAVSFPISYGLVKSISYDFTLQKIDLLIYHLLTLRLIRYLNDLCYDDFCFHDDYYS